MKKNLLDNLAMTVAEIGDIEFPAEILEFSIDQVIDEGLLKDIPFVGWIAKEFSVGRSISDRIFYHKILRFLIALDKIGKDDRESFRKKVMGNPDFRRKVGEHLFDRTSNKQTHPPLEIIEEVANDFISRLRYATNTSKIN